MVKYVFWDVGTNRAAPSLKMMPWPLIASLAGSVMNNVLQNKANDRNIENQNMLWQKQQDIQARNNAYASLIQRQGLERAGMNVNSENGPNLALQAPAPPKSDVVAPNMDMSVMAQLLQQQPLIDSQISLNKAQEGLVKSQEGKTSAETDKIVQETLNLAVENGLLQFQSDTQKQLFEANMQKLFADIDNVEANTSNINFDTLIKGEKLDQERLETIFQQQTFDQRKQTYLWTLNKIKSEVALNGANKKLAIANTNKAYAEASFTRSQEQRLKGLFDSEKHRIEQETATSGRQAEMYSWQSDYYIAMAGLVKTQQDWQAYEEILKGVGVTSQVINSIANVVGEARGTHFKVSTGK